MEFKQYPRMERLTRDLKAERDLRQTPVNYRDEFEAIKPRFEELQELEDERIDRRDQDGMIRRLEDQTKFLIRDAKKVIENLYSNDNISGGPRAELIEKSAGRLMKIH